MEETPAQPSDCRKAAKFQRLLSVPSVDLAALRSLMWSGAPEDDPTFRADAWQMLLGYLPPVVDRRTQGVARKRNEYEELKRRHLSLDEDGSILADTDDSGAGSGKDLLQIRKDVPRLRPESALFRHPKVQQLMERVLYIWSVRHPASGYVQGIDELVIPFIIVFLASELRTPLNNLDVDSVPPSVLSAVEAGAYWCLTRLLSDIQDHYTSGQPGIQQMLLRLADIVRRVDEKLYNHLAQQEGPQVFITFSFQWMNCLLLRELPLPCGIRLWDAYVSEPAGSLGALHVYVCAAFLMHWSSQLKEMDTLELLPFIRNLPTTNWTSREIESVLAEAFVLKSWFHSSPNHLAAPD